MDGLLLFRLSLIFQLGPTLMGLFLMDLVRLPVAAAGVFTRQNASGPSAKEDQ